MSVIATIAIAANGATSLHGSSRQLSTPADRSRFLALHRSAGAYVVGRNSFASESYASATAPVLILSSDKSAVVGAEIVDSGVGLANAMKSIRSMYSEPIVVEAGPRLLMALARGGCIEEIEISLLPRDGDNNFIDTAEILSLFEIYEASEVDGVTLLKGRYKGSSAYS